MLPKEKLKNMLKMMWTIRLFEEKVKDLYRANLITGAIHSYAGEEAVAVGVCSCLNKDDYIVSTHRGHGHAIAKGGRLDKIFAELMGRETGCCRGRGGSMHLFDIEIGLLGGNGIVGAGIPIAVGAGLSSKYRNSNQVAVAFFGDGASNNGTFHESINLASLWKLPVIFICENNLIAATTAYHTTSSIDNIADRSIGYGIPGKVVDGMDVLEVYNAVSEVVKRSKSNEGPTLIECKTYRFEPHCMVLSDNRPQEGVEEWKKKDPIINFESKLLNDKVMTSEEIEKMKQKINEEINSAVVFAKESPYPDPKELIGLSHCV